MILRAMLTAARFVDELVLIDKGRLGVSAFPISKEFDARWAREMWSPTVEQSRSMAAGLCTHDWIVCLDDDEILSPACAGTFRDFVAGNHADVLEIPIKHYILGRHDPAAYYWPEWRPVLARRGAVEYGGTVHGGVRPVGRVERLPAAGDAFITHLSHPDVATWLEKTNRYTSQPDRSGVSAPIHTSNLLHWAKDQLDVPATLDEYRDSVLLLRKLYDIIDGLKRWEATQLDGHAAFLEIAKAEIERER